ncbi:MAG: hypothetical protein JETT_3189 [Candidatus Jettenia ecosi]|uniref:Uncharacterized protein n=1 Tax=Candidatus Jettenia ecosi TaxID=2494326 RepID=A0A533Q7F3_9BACT|nr:MAG: hypothetical protein JETT_3189 [Candidatus Jettenia ecosi]
MVLPGIRTSWQGSAKEVFWSYGPMDKAALVIIDFCKGKLMDFTFLKKI